MILTLDTENTIFAKGNPFSEGNKCCVVGYKINDKQSVALSWEYDEPVSQDKLTLIQGLLDECTLLVGFNLKYDLHWLRKYGLALPKKTYCTQVAQFVIRNQQEKYPSLDSSCAYWGLGQKLNVIEEEYWSKGINTDQIPWKLLDEYSRQDVDLTYSLFLKQQEYLRSNPSKKSQLINLLNQDLLVLEEMEWHGLVFDTQLAESRSNALTKEIEELDKNIRSIIGPYPINFNSTDHVSCILYGGTIRFKNSEPYEHIYKSGQRAGVPVIRYKHSFNDVTFEQLVKPLEGSELAKKGYWSTDAGTFKKLRPKGKARSIIQLLQQRAEKEQLVSTYYIGWPNRIVEMKWPANEVHSSLNQCVAVTGRLSSNGPNQQNVPSEVYDCIKTRAQE